MLIFLGVYTDSNPPAKDLSALSLAQEPMETESAQISNAPLEKPIKKPKKRNSHGNNTKPWRYHEIPKLCCVYCKKSGAPEEYYSNHVLRDAKGIVVCPVLRRYNCPKCQNGGGDRAHTLGYCPLNTGSGPSWGQYLSRTRNSMGRTNHYYPKH